MNTKEYDASLSESLLSKLFDSTGVARTGGGTKGFLMFYVNGDGNVDKIQKAESGAVALALLKAAEIHVSAEENSQ